MSEAARTLIDRYAIHALLAAVIGLGGFVWADIRETRDNTYLIKFQQIEDHKDIVSQGKDIEKLKADVDAIKYTRGKSKANFNGDTFSIGDGPLEGQ